MTEEAVLGNFKSASARALMGLKFGGLMEACETGCVVGRVGQVIVAVSVCVLLLCCVPCFPYVSVCCVRRTEVGEHHQRRACSVRGVVVQCALCVSTLPPRRAVSFWEGNVGSPDLRAVCYRSGLD
jgi:hypothetical protein